MDIGTFSTSEVDAYDVDGVFLSQLRQRLIDQIADVVHPDTIHTETKVTIKPRDYAEIARSDATGAILTDGSFAGGGGHEVHQVEINVGGIAPHGGDPWGGSVYVSLTLRPRGGDWLYAKGPVHIAGPAFETMRGALAARAIAIPERIAIGPVTAPRMDGHAWRRRIPWITGLAGLLCYFVCVLGIAGYSRYAFAGIVGGLAATIVSLIAAHAMATSDERARREGRSSDPEKPSRRIDLTRAAAGEDPALGHDPLTPVLFD